MKEFCPGFYFEMKAGSVNLKTSLYFFLLRNIFYR